jgi:VanZ family protein
LLVLKSVARSAAWLLAAVIVILSLVPPDLRPETGAPHAVEHLSIYAAAGLAFAIGYDRHEIRLATLLVVFAAVVEMSQLLVHGRHARLSDFAVDAAALIAGLVLVALARRTGRLTRLGAE